MRATYLAAVVGIYAVVSIAWLALGGTVSLRTERSLERLRAQVGGLWGTPLEQRAPTLVVEETFTVKDEKGVAHTKTESHPLVPDSSDIKVNLRSDARRKGLLWYRTYAVEFDATYTVTHSFTRQPTLVATFMFPSAQAIYDDFSFSINGREADAGTSPQGVSHSVALPPGEVAVIRVHYNSRGLDTWAYRFADGVSQVRDFTLVAQTDFHRLDFPEGTISPSHKQETDAGWRLSWQFTNLLSGFRIGIETPEQPNPGPVIARISYFAPVGLLFFLAVVVITTVLRRRPMHPMHYFFIAGGFFAFHLLMAYLGDHVEIRLTFLTCAVVSVALVVSYLVRAVGPGLALKVVAPAQFVFLVLFSYAFFFEGYTGLTLTLASILTLAIMMHVTARVDWEKRLSE